MHAPNLATSAAESSAPSGGQANAGGSDANGTSVRCLTNDSTAAIAAADDAVRLAPRNRLMVVMRGQVLALAGRRDEARVVAQRASDDARREPIANFELARLYALLGERDAALDWIGRSIEAREMQTTQLHTPGFETLRDDPRFAIYLRAMNMNPAPR